MTRFAFINLSQLPPPDIVETISFEKIYQELIADYRNRNPEYSAHIVESDPVVKALEVGAYREVRIRQRINEAVRAVMLAYAERADLDQLGAFYGVKRKVIEAGNPAAFPPIEPTLENDTDFRRRIQLAPEAFTTAGSDGSYIFNALSAGEAPSDVTITSPEAGKIIITYSFAPETIASKVKDASVHSPAPVEVIVSILGHEGTGEVTEETLNIVRNHLSGKYVRPTTDKVTVQKAEILNYSVVAKLFIQNGPDAQVVLQEAEKRCWDYVHAQHILGGEVNRSGLDAAMHIGGVRKVQLEEWTDITATYSQAPYCTSITITPVSP